MTAMIQWNQRLADGRNVETMRRIALDVQDFGDDHRAFEAYAAKHKMTVNEVVYYLNAYEFGGDAGLRALHAPDSIPPVTARRAIKTVASVLEAHFQDRLPYRLTDEGTAIGLYEVQQRRQTGDNFLFPVCQFRLTVAGHQWHLYWMREFDAWWPYSLPHRGRKHSLKARAQQVVEDEFGCFWG